MPSPSSAHPVYPNPYPYPKQAATLFPAWRYAEVIQISTLTFLREIYGRRRFNEDHEAMEFRVYNVAKVFKTDYKKLYRCMIEKDELLTRRDLMFRFRLNKRKASCRRYPVGLRVRNIVRYYASDTIDLHLRRYA